jgi:hypothetical protein
MALLDWVSHVFARHFFALKVNGDGSSFFEDRQKDPNSTAPEG